MSVFFYLWLIIALLCVILEMGYPGLFFFLSFALGALITAGSTLFYISFVMQCVLFMVASVVSLVFLIKWVRCSSDRDLAHQKTNTQALIGRKAVVMRKIHAAQPGEVKIGGELWMARSFRDQAIEIDTQVTVIQVCGAHVVVEPVSRSV